MGLSRILPRSQPRDEPAAEEPAADVDAEPDAAPRLLAVPEPDVAPLVQEQVMASVIAFANQKGGVAKTTTTLNLGVALGELGHRVLLIDLDPQGNLTMSQGMNPDAIERSMFDVLVHRVPIEEVLQNPEDAISTSTCSPRRGARSSRIHPLAPLA